MEIFSAWSHWRQAIELVGKFVGNSLKKSVPATRPKAGQRRDQVGVYAQGGERKYTNAEERGRVLEAAEALDPERSLFVQLLVWTGMRVSELLALTPASFQLESGLVTVVTLKRRGLAVREIPVPPKLMAALDRQFGLRHAQRGEASACRRLWPFCRTTAWRIVKKVMAAIGIAGRRASPRGLRHGFGTGTLQSGVPLNIIQRWMGHARMTTTAIYAAVSGPEEIAFARRFWETHEQNASPMARTCYAR